MEDLFIIKNSFIIKKKIVNYFNSNDDLLSYIDAIIKELFGLKNIDIIKQNSNLYIVKNNGEYICDFNIDCVLNYNVLKIKLNNKTYTYYIENSKTDIKVTMKEYNCIKKNYTYNAYFCYDKCLIHVNSSDKCLYLETEIDEKNKLIDVVDGIKPMDDIIDIYKKVASQIKKENIIIKRTNINNASYTNNDVTDYLMVKNNRLIEFKVTILRKDKKYLVEKGYDDYKITIISTGLDGFEKTYFDIGNTLNFAKKLEKR